MFYSREPIYDNQLSEEINFDDALSEIDRYCLDETLEGMESTDRFVQLDDWMKIGDENYVKCNLGD